MPRVWQFHVFGTGAKRGRLQLGEQLQRDLGWRGLMRQGTGHCSWEGGVAETLEAVKAEEVPCQSTAFTEQWDSISNRCQCTLSSRLIFFGGYGYFPEGEQRGTFEFDETSFGVSQP